jgi:hypothetical protein
MKILEDITEDEMILNFLIAELDSKRFGHHISNKLKNDKISQDIIRKANLNNKEENMYRKNLLNSYRGYGQKAFIFDNFPTNVK